MEAESIPSFKYVVGERLKVGSKHQTRLVPNHVPAHDVSAQSCPSVSPFQHTCTPEKNEVCTARMYNVQTGARGAVASQVRRSVNEQGFDGGRGGCGGGVGGKGKGGGDS